MRRDDGDAQPGIKALQITLAAEHAAVFVYGVLGARTSQATQPVLYRALTASYSVHRDRRDELTSQIDAAGADPVAAEPGYQLPVDLDSADAVRRRALSLERGASKTYAYLVASTSAATREWAVAALVDSAVRSLSFGGQPEPLPGL